MQNLRSKGNTGEEIACGYLQANGYTVLQRNFTTRYGELDIIAQQGDTLVFVEVKMRTSARCGYGREAVTFKKQKALRTAAQIYLQKQKLYDVKARFDVLELTGPAAFPEIDHIQNAF